MNYYNPIDFNSDNQFWILVNENNIAQGIDMSSGGYPFNATSPNSVNFWAYDQLDECRRYCSMFPKFKIALVTVKFMGFTGKD